MRAIWWSSRATARLLRGVHGAGRAEADAERVRQTAREPRHQRRGRVPERPRGVTLLADTPLTAARALALVKMLADDAISSKQGKEVFAAVMDEGKDPAAIVEARGMKQVSATPAPSRPSWTSVIAANPDEVARYRDGNTKLIGFFVGQCMKEMRGQGNPKIINQILAKKLG